MIFDPIIGAQDFDNPNFKIQLQKISTNKVKVSFKNSGQVTNILFVLVTSSNRWKIKDIIYSDGVSLDKTLSEINK